MGSLADGWEQHADRWISWARTSGHDAFADSTWPQLEAVLPAPAELVIEVGCGEGRVSRALLARGDRHVIGVERSATLVFAAQHRHGGPCVVQADAASLPIVSGRVDVVVACMSLHDVDDLRVTVQEIGRVLRPAGSLCVAMVHPFVSAVDPAAMHEGAVVVVSPYLIERNYEDRVERAGHEMTFVSRHRPLSVYLNEFAAAGLALDELREFGSGPLPWLLTARLTKAAGRRW